MYKIFSISLRSSNICVSIFRVPFSRCPLRLKLRCRCPVVCLPRCFFFPPWKFPVRSFVCLPHLPYACYMHYAAHPSGLNCSNCIR
jgi:hypothetical protein